MSELKNNRYALGNSFQIKEESNSNSREDNVLLYDS
jgi:hypothetical protein